MTQVTATFPVSGRVTGVTVAVGDSVTAGQPLANLDTGPLQQAVLDAQAQLAQAQAQLASETSPSMVSSSSGSGSAGSGSAGSAGRPDATGPRAGTTSSGGAGPSGAGSSPGSAGKASSTSGSTDGAGSSASALARLQPLVSTVDAAVKAQKQACLPVLGRLGTPLRQTETTPPSTAPTSPVPSTAPKVNASPAGWLSAAGPVSSSPTSIASPTTPVSTKPATADQVAGCVAAMSAVGTAQANVTLALREMSDASGRGGPSTAASPTTSGTSTGTGAARTSTGSNSRASSAPAAGTSSAPVRSTTPAPTTATASAPATGTAAGTRAGASTGTAAAGGSSTESRSLSGEAAVSTAQLALDTANANLAAATLTAPIAGTVGSIGFSVGGAANTSAGIVIVGPGAATVTADVPLANLPSVRTGQQVLVTAAGATQPVDGTVSAIGLLPVSSTNASTPSYPVTVLVPQVGNALSSGSRADVSIVTARAPDALTVPASAMAMVSTGTGVVTILKDGIATRTTVRTGAVGGGLVQVTEGLTAGQEVVIADRSEPLPTATTSSRRLTGGGVSGGPQGGGGFIRKGGNGGAPARGAPAGK